MLAAPFAELSQAPAPGKATLQAAGGSARRTRRARVAPVIELSARWRQGIRPKFHFRTKPALDFGGQGTATKVAAEDCMQYFAAGFPYKIVGYQKQLENNACKPEGRGSYFVFL